MATESRHIRGTAAASNRQPKFRRRAAARPDEVLDAAAELFTRQGFAKTTVDQIASRAGLSKGAVYLYFPSKKALLAGLVRRAIVPAADQVLELVASYHGDPRPVIAQVMNLMAHSLTNKQVLAVPKLVIREAVNAPEIAQMYRQEVLDKAIPALTGLIAQGVASGHIRAVDPELTIRSVVGPLMLHIMLAEVFEIQPSDGFAFDRLITNHLTILFAGLEPPKDTK